MKNLEINPPGSKIIVLMIFFSYPFLNEEYIIRFLTPDIQILNHTLSFMSFINVDRFCVQPASYKVV